LRQHWRRRGPTRPATRAGQNQELSDWRAPGAPLRSTGATGPPGAGVRMCEALGVRGSRRIGIGEGHPKSRQREGVRIGASGSSQRDRPGLQGPGALGAPRTLESERRIGMRVSGSASEVQGPSESGGASGVAPAEARSNHTKRRCREAYRPARQRRRVGSPSSYRIASRATGGPRKRRCASTGAGGAGRSGVQTGEA